jgi:DNA (cytosine-5)-methyltransferase 1
MDKKYKLLDLFCGAGGAAMGYYRAGFEVVGVDINLQPHYPFEFYQADALDFDLKEFDAVHASPPCQAFCSLNTLHKKEYPDLIALVRQKLMAYKKPYIIENVPRAPLFNPILLCGSMFENIELRRHRLFECSFPSIQLECNHKIQQHVIGVYGKTGNGSDRNAPRKHGYSSLKVDWERAMGINWMTIKELSQAIPPVYTKYIGKYLMSYLEEMGDDDI